MRKENGKIRRVLEEELGEEHVETREQGLVSIKLEEEASSLGKKRVWLLTNCSSSTRLANLFTHVYKLV